MRRLGVTLVVVLGLVPAAAQGQIFADDFEYGSPNGWSGIEGWAPAAVGRTGQVTCYDENGAVIPCAGTGQDGDLRPGVAWPVPRFVDNGDGTVTDNLTNLIWLKYANCFGSRSWTQALNDANTLSAGWCGLTDGSVAGDWHLPSVNELQSLVDYEYGQPPLSNAAGTDQWSEGDAFSGVLVGNYWSSSTQALWEESAWSVSFYDGELYHDFKMTGYYVWPARGPR